jgi:DHA1 family tetracycline resistance protein-like MFS transporter
MMFVIIFANLLGGVFSAALTGIVSGAARADEQGQTMGAISSLNSAMAVVAPMIGPPLLAVVAHLPQGDWRIGAPLFVCAALQAVALLLAWLHFRRMPATAAAATAPGH